ncbi:MAG: hypothetical protein QOF78_707, partial [Phycisphaerales bacterium]|nr:hypothetical protein [Phycisphaerales bacterium]
AQAEAMYREVLQRHPDHPDALHLLGVAAHQQGRHEEACALIRRAIARNPSCAAFHYNLAEALRPLGQLAQAETAFRRAIELEPGNADAHNSLGNLLLAQRRLDEAAACCRRALALNPQLAAAQYNLGTVLLEQCNGPAAVEALRRATELAPTFAPAFHNLSSVLMELHQLEPAEAALRRAMELEPDNAAAWNNMGQLRKAQGCPADAIDCFRRAIELDPARADVHSNLLLAMAYCDGPSARDIFEEHLRWADRHAKSHYPPAADGHSNDRSPDRRLRIGYVSPDLRQHPVGFFIEPLIAAHRREQVEVFCYSDACNCDALTRRLESVVAAGWRDIAGVEDVRVAEIIRQDRIDILIDLAGHTARNRMLVFARKPAPVQVSYLGYTTTTGLATMDYALSDQYLDPPGAHERFRTESLVRLPRTYVCYVPPMRCPEIGPLPAARSAAGSAAGRVTFACLNNFTKVTPRAQAAWTQILKKVPAGRLMLHACEPRQIEEVRACFTAGGVDPARLEFAGKRPLNEYFALHNEIDIALDPFPHNGGTTTCDALWMGVPVVSFAGEHAVSRAGLSLLSTIGLAELVAGSLEGYVEIAVQLAGELTRLTGLRTTLRQRMAASPLMDAAGFARDVESAYRAMWQRWCASRSSPS